MLQRAEVLTTYLGRRLDLYRSMEQATPGVAVSDVFTMAFMLTGRLLAESLRVGADLEVADLRVVRIGRHEVSNSTTPFDGSDPAGDSPQGAVAG